MSLVEVDGHPPQGHFGDSETDSRLMGSLEETGEQSQPRGKWWGIRTREAEGRRQEAALLDAAGEREAWSCRRSTLWGLAHNAAPPDVGRDLGTRRTQAQH